MEEYLPRILKNIQQHKYSNFSLELKQKILNGEVILEKEHLLILYQEKIKFFLEYQTRNRQAYKDIIKNLMKTEEMTVKKKVKLLDKCLYYA